MNKLKHRIRFTNIVLYLFALSIVLYLIYRFVFSTKESLINASTLTTQLLCRNDMCMKGCKKPTKITEQCGKSIYRDIQNKCFKLCPYICENKEGEAPCIANDCCVGCKQVKFEVPCGDLIPTGVDAGIASDGSIMPFFATGYGDIEHDPRATKKAVQVYRMMKDVSAVYNEHTGDLLNTNNYDCLPNITGTFTECGPPPSTRMNYE